MAFLPWSFSFLFGHTAFGGEKMKRRKQRLDKPKFDSSGIGLVPIGYPGEFGFFVDRELPQDSVSQGDFI